MLGPVLHHGNADEVLYRYEGDVLPYDQTAGWIVADACDGLCTEKVDCGRFINSWPEPADISNYHLWIARSGEPSPPSLWVEWRYKSNHPIGPYTFRCDGRFSIIYLDIFDNVNLYGDSAISHSGSDYVFNLELDEFHTYRFESPDGSSFTFFVDGIEIWRRIDNDDRDITYIQFGGWGGCGSDWIPNMVNEWDFVRYGTIDQGEELESADPAAGVLDARQHAGLDRFLVMFQEPAYVYVDEIAVEVIDAAATATLASVEPPIVKATRRREPPDPFDVVDDPRIVEIVLDRPIPFNATTRFTLDDGVAVNVVEYTFVPGDVEGSGTVDLSDIAYLQNCMGAADTATLCGVFDLGRDTEVGFDDALDVIALIGAPVPK